MEYFMIYMLIINLLSFLVYYIDKRRAIKDQWRIKESTLHLLSFAGGVYGSIAAMTLFRHKTKKFQFYIVTIVALIFNVYILMKGVRSILG